MVAIVGTHPITLLIPAAVILGLFKNLPSQIQTMSEVGRRLDALGPSFNHPGNGQNKTEEYDYVIIGAGSAGAVVANRLSKDRRLRILIIQDGGNPNPFIAIPGLANEVRHQPSTDYDYKIVKQSNACLAEDSYEKNCIFSRGIGLGGTSNLYSMTVVRGNPKDYDRWAELSGDSTWGYENVLSIFKNQEDYQGFYQPPDKRYHGIGGESFVSPQVPAPFPTYFFKACEESGLAVNIDANGNQTVGCGHLDVNIKRGKRWGSYDAFLKPILGRPNLKIYRYAKATKINFDGAMRATGVTYTRHGVTRTVNAKHEVILAAGSIDSPKLLMLSGIGPAEHLKTVGIKQLLELPVGMTLHDHVGVNIEFSVNKTNIAFIPERDFTLDVSRRYIFDGTGPLASPFFNSRTLAFTTSTEFKSPNWPDIEILSRGEYQKSSQGNGKYVDKFLVQVFLLRPLSSGELKLASANPNDPPIIDPKYFSNESDMNRLVEGLEFAMKLFETTEAFAGIDAKLIPIPECSQNVQRKEFLECIIRQNTVTLCHPTGTVKMGIKNDASTVLDSNLRVLGTTGLRVVDSSIMPTIPAGHTHTPSMMIGEIGAQFINEARRP